MYITISIFILLILVVMAFFRQAKFGRLPSGERLARNKNSPNWKNGSFQNKSITPDLTEGATYLSVSREYFFGDKKKKKPTGKIPSVKTDLLQLDSSKDVLVWFGHSSYFLQVDGKRILVDPVLGGSASPLPSSVRAFDGSDIYRPVDIPDIDFLFISHDHWDHMDHGTLKKLRPKINKIICGLGTGEHLEHWGFTPDSIIEKDWDQEVILAEGFKVNTVPARHFSGRGLKRNQALWLSFVLQTPTMKIFLGGDSGYDTHFAEIGEEFGPFDLAVLENGQYDKSWKHIHLMPEEGLKAAGDLKASKVLPVHSGKFSISNHAWDEPLTRISGLGKQSGITILTPRIGETVNIKDNTQVFSDWWRELK